MAEFSRFAVPLDESEERERYLKAIPKRTNDTTKWGINIYRKWVDVRVNKIAALELAVGEHDTSVVQSLDTPLEEMDAVSLNFWLCKFIREVRNKDGELYPMKTLYQIVCCFKRKFEQDGRDDMNPIDKSNSR